MQKNRWAIQPKPGRTARVLAAMTAAIALTAGPFAAVIPAQAAVEQSEYTDITVANEAGGTEFKTYDKVIIHLNWTLSDDASAGSALTVPLPKNPDGTNMIQGTPGEAFDLIDGPGNVVSECVVSPNGMQLDCPISATWLKDNPSQRAGTLEFTAKITTAAPDGTYRPVFGTESAKNDITVEVIPFNPPGTNHKTVSPLLWEQNTAIRWYLYPATPVGGWKDGQSIVMSDSLGACQEAWGDEVRVQYVTEASLASKGAVDPWIDVPSAGDSVIDKQGSTVDISITTREAIAYRVALTTKATCGSAGSPYANNATIQGDAASATYFWNYGGGTGTGVGGTFILSKELIGSGADLADAAEYVVAYTYRTASGGTTGDGELRVAANGSVTSPVLPIGATVTLTEIAPADIRGTEWTKPVFSRNSFQVVKGGTVNVLLTNEINRKTGELLWSKVDAADESVLLAGSEWELSGPDGAVVSVVDNGENDADPAVGKVRVEGLAWGEYSLVETVAPVGFVKSDEVRTLSVTASALRGEFGAITNEAVPPTTPPTTTTTTPPTKTPTPPAATLAATGATTAVPLAALGGMLLLGATAMLFARRIRHAG